MKQMVFYSLVFSNGKYCAKLWNGWTDGKYNYYQNKSQWNCICPDSGLKIAEGKTRKLAQSVALLMADKVAEKKLNSSWSEMINLFSRKIQEAT